MVRCLFLCLMKIKSVTLWSYYTRLLHWLLALSVLFLVLSGWLMGKIIEDALFWIEWHHMVGQFMVLLLLARVVLFFQQGNSHYSRYKISAKDSKSIIETLKFYLSLARTPLPAWFAFNPLWRILYAIFYIMLVFMAFSGLASDSNLVLGVYWPSVHQTLAAAINIWLVLHLLAVFVHDWKSRVNRISAMLSGVAYFEVDEAAGSNIKPPQENIIQTSFNLNNDK